MKLDTLTLDRACITQVVSRKKMTVHNYLYTDLSKVTETGLGERVVTVTGVVKGAAERDALELALQTSGEKKLYFPSEIGGEDDRYYKGKTSAVTFDVASADVWRYSFTLTCENPAVFDAQTDEELF